MPIHFACVAHGMTVLCSHQKGSGKFTEVVTSMLKQVSSSNGRNSYSADNYCYHCLSDNRMVYICATDEEMGKYQPYSCLAEVQKQFCSGSLLLRAPSAAPNDLQRDFGGTLKQLMERFSKSGDTDKTSKLRAQVDEVKGIMTQNIEKVLQRGERLEDLMDKTEDLEASAQAFHVTARRVRRKLFWKNRKMCIILLVVLLIVILIIVLIVLFKTGVIKT